MRSHKTMGPVDWGSIPGRGKKTENVSLRIDPSWDLGSIPVVGRRQNMSLWNQGASAGRIIWPARHGLRASERDHPHDRTKAWSPIDPEATTMLHIACSPVAIIRRDKKGSLAKREGPHVLSFCGDAYFTNCAMRASNQIWLILHEWRNG